MSSTIPVNTHVGLAKTPAPGNSDSCLRCLTGDSTLVFAWNRVVGLVRGIGDGVNGVLRSIAYAGADRQHSVPWRWLCRRLLLWDVVPATKRCMKGKCGLSTAIAWMKSQASRRSIGTHAGGTGRSTTPTVKHVIDWSSPSGVSGSLQHRSRTPTHRIPIRP